MQVHVFMQYVDTATLVMPGLDPGIHVLLTSGDKDVDGRDKPGHDGEGGGKDRLALSFRPFGARTPPRLWPPHPWRLAADATGR